MLEVQQELLEKDPGSAEVEIAGIMSQTFLEIEILAHTTRWGWGNHNNLNYLNIS